MILDETVGEIILYLGGTGGIAAFVAKWISTVTENRVKQEFQGKLDKDLADFKSQLEQKIYRSNLKFEKELTIYGELSSKSIEMVFANASYISEVFSFAPDAEKTELAKKRAFDAYNDSNKTTKKYAPFVSKEIYEKYRNLNNLCVQIFDEISIAILSGYTQSVPDSISSLRKQLSDMSNDTLDYVRNHLAKLEGKDDGQAENAQCR